MSNLKLAVGWIAQNDNSGNGDSVKEIEGYMTVMMAADVFGRTARHIALMVADARRTAGLEVGES